MSFILDALRKSENERQRGAVPSITRAPLARPRQRAPVWSIILIAMLALCVVVLAGAWWLTAGPPGATQAQSQAHSPAQRPRQNQEPAAMQFEPAPPSATTDAAASAVDQSVTPGSSGIARAGDSSGALAPPRTSPLETLAVSRPAVSTSVTPPAGADTPRSPAGSVGSGSSSSSTSTDVPPTILELATEGVVMPDLDMTLHRYSDSAAQRFVFINGTRYREGETLREGPQVVSIDADQVVLTYRGTRFRIRAR